MDLRNTPHDTCPLCRQQALTFSDNLLRCSSCQSVAELDPASHRIKYITVAPTYQGFESALKQDWLTRRQVFELTTRPLPIVVFLPIILSLLALCILLGTAGAVLAIRPSLMNTRALIEAAYAPTADLTANPPLSGTLTSQSPIATGEITETQTPEANPTFDPNGPIPTGTIQVSIETSTPSVDPNLVTATPSPPSPPLEGLFTNTPLPATNTPVPTSAPRVIGPTPGLTSPLATPTGAPNAATLTPSPNPAQSPTPSTVTATPTATQSGAATPTPTLTPNPAAPSPTPGPTVTVIFSGTFPSGTTGRSELLSNSIVIADVKVKGDPSFNEGDEYIDIRNNSDLQSITMIHWKIRINNGASFFIPNEVSSASFSIPPQQGCRIYTGSVASQNTPPPYNWCGAQSLGSLASVTGVYTNDHGTIEILDESGKTVASFTY